MRFYFLALSTYLFHLRVVWSILYIYIAYAIIHRNLQFEILLVLNLRSLEYPLSPLSRWIQSGSKCRFLLTFCLFIYVRLRYIDSASMYLLSRYVKTGSGRAANADSVRTRVRGGGTSIDTRSLMAYILIQRNSQISVLTRPVKRRCYSRLQLHDDHTSLIILHSYYYLSNVWDDDV